MSDLKDTVNNSTDGAWSDKYRDGVVKHFVTTQLSGLPHFNHC